MKILVALGCLLCCTYVFADPGTCAAPTPLLSNSTVSGTTCGGEIGINMGGTIYVHPSSVFSLHLDHVNDPNKISIHGEHREMALTASCATAPIAIGAPGLDIDGSEIPSGDYLVIVSTDPSIPATNPPTCGAFDLNILSPVTLQSFVVD